jgi:DNA-binding CsgD family transcriptional regulator/GAF domain-containing protein
MTMTSRTAAVEDGWSPSTQAIDDAGLRADVAAVLGRAARVLEGADAPAEEESPDLASAIARIDDATLTLTASLRSGGSSIRARGTTRDEVVDLMLDLRDVAARLSEAQEAARQESFGRVRDAMALLRGVNTVDQMLDQAPIAAARLGFDRTFVSAIQDSYFVPRTCFIKGDTEWAAAVVRAGQDQPRRLDRTLLETEMVRRRQPIRVLDAQNDPRVHREIADVSMSRSYVAAPVIVQDKVIGFVHADYYAQRRLVGATDSDLLWMFTEAFGFAYERIAYGERIAALRSSYMRTMADAERNFARAIEEEISFDEHLVGAHTGGDDEAARPAPMPMHRPVSGERSALDALLTRRELEVLRLMASGATNDGIASRLVISHGTAKTHVKHILRKLSAANRAEAVSRYFQLEHRTQIPT